MTAFEQLNAYLKRLEWRLRFFVASRGAALVAGFALLLTILLVSISNHYAFAQHVVFPLRIALFVALATTVSFALAWPLLKMTRRRIMSIVEQRAPKFQERLLTLTERQKAGDPWSEVLAEDALRIASAYRPEEISSSRFLWAALGSGLVSTAILLWLILAGPGYWGYGASLLWTGNAAASKRPLYDITVQPGDKVVRRKSDQLVTAQLFGFSANNVTLHVKYGNAPKWDQAPMQPKPDGDGYRFLFAGLADVVEYYVQADRAQSRHFTIHVKDLPSVKRVRVALKYPTGLGLQNVMLDPGGDIRAVNGTEAEISILTDKPLEQGSLVLDGGKKVALKAGEGNWLSARLHVEKDGSYHVAAIDNGETIRISDDYFIEAKKDEPPTVKLLKPGHDPHVSPIEEVPVTVDAADDFGVQGLELHYSVNGGPEKTIPLLKAKGAKEMQGTATIAFEDLKVVPGDVVSMYATARDAATKAQSEMIFAQAEPFDFKFSQSQQMGGGGGGGGMGNQSSDISQRQKQIIAATFNEVRDKGKSRAALVEDAKLLSELQSKLSEQALTLAQRMASRELGSAGTEFARFSKLMTDASGDMAVAVEQLKPGKWNDALAPEQKALGSLMRAEALFRDIQVAFNQQSGGGGGGNSGAQRDLARMFDLELDTSKNQYETGQQASAQQQQQDVQKALDEAYQRLQALARRQEALASQNSQQQQQFEQRWEEEQLRREAEELRKQMQQLAQNSQNQSQSANGSSGGNQPKNSAQASASSGQSGQSGSAGSNRSADSSGPKSAQEKQMADTMKRADNALQRAEDEMRKAVSDHDASARQRAASQLREAQGLMNRMMAGQAGNSVGDLANRAEEVAKAQKEIASRMKEMYGEGSFRNRQPSSSSGQSGAEQMPEMRDPTSTRFGYGFQRRYGMSEMRPSRPATSEEKTLAGEKEKLAAELQHLQQEMQQQSQGMAGSRPETSAKLSRALSEAESKELALRMQKGADWMRQGYGDRNVGMEDAVTAGLQQLSRDLHEAQSAMNKPGSSSPGQGNDKTARALAEVRQLREELDRKSADTLQRGGENGQDGQGQQPGNSNNGQSGGQPGGQKEARNGSYSGRGDGFSGLNREGVQSAIGQLRGLRTQVDPRDRALTGYIDGALGTLQHLTGAQAGLLDARLNQDAFLSLQRLEVELNKRVTQQEAGGTRTGAREESPEKYRDAVAGYFKKLSQGKSTQNQ